MFFNGKEIIKMYAGDRYIEKACLLGKDISFQPEDDFRWKVSFFDDFEGTELNKKRWDYCPEWERFDGSYWSDDMAYLDGKGNLVLKIEKRDDKYYSGAIRTRTKDGVNLFEQTYGYFEARCKVPQNYGIWGAFWLLAESQGNSEAVTGVEGAEIDIFESIHYANRETGHGVHWGGYEDGHSSITRESKLVDIYDGGFHVFAVKWAKNMYVFYVDGEEVWRTDAGGICEVPTYIKLTTEVNSIDFPIEEDGVPAEMLVDYVKVYSFDPEFEIEPINKNLFSASKSNAGSIGPNTITVLDNGFWIQDEEETEFSGMWAQFTKPLTPGEEYSLTMDYEHLADHTRVGARVVCDGEIIASDKSETKKGALSVDFIYQEGCELNLYANETWFLPAQTSCKLTNIALRKKGIEEDDMSFDVSKVIYGAVGDENTVELLEDGFWIQDTKPATHCGMWGDPSQCDLEEGETYRLSCEFEQLGDEQQIYASISNANYEKLQEVYIPLQTGTIEMEFVYEEGIRFELYNNATWATPALTSCKYTNFNIERV